MQISSFFMDRDWTSTNEYLVLTVYFILTRMTLTSTQPMKIQACDWKNEANKILFMHNAWHQESLAKKCHHSTWPRIQWEAIISEIQQNKKEKCGEQTINRISHPFLVSEPYPTTQLAKFHLYKEQALEAWTSASDSPVHVKVTGQLIFLWRIKAFSAT